MREYRGRASFSYSFCTALPFLVDRLDLKPGRKIEAPLAMAAPREFLTPILEDRFIKTTRIINSMANKAFY